MQIDLRRELFQQILAPGEGILSADEAEEVVSYERIDGSQLQFLIPTSAFENNLAGFAKAARSALGGGGSDLVNAGRWLHFVMMEKANDMSPVGKRGYRLTNDGSLLPWD
ncbi:hypothetical protein SAMN05216554_2686 [Herbiconiux ginsengi]|uniref:Uncharacterized protein n=1 Tax=Herbiconiux ginsengi TaxID=381665 RepID=A0A1H3QRV2_9MICO|nr:hypothetical protein SAMN05216554_2686 [Herbiconiux ginsengi]